MELVENATVLGKIEMTPKLAPVKPMLSPVDYAIVGPIDLVFAPRGD